MVYWGGDFGRFEQVFLEHGAVVDLRPLRKKAIGPRRSARQQALLEGI
jgi:hypothetical protein